MVIYGGATLTNVDGFAAEIAVTVTHSFCDGIIDSKVPVPLFCDTVLLCACTVNKQ